MIALTCLTPIAVDPAAAQAASTGRLCAERANLRDSPRGFIIGRLRRPQRLTIIRRNPDRRWTQVRTSTGLAGWMPSGSVCRGR
jgi:hypothetical protein